MTIFTYWNGDPTEIAGFVSDWSAAGVNMTIYGPKEVGDCLREFSPGAGDLFSRIRIAACQSDLARLALLFAHGGLYVDAHAGNPDPGALMKVFARLATCELVAFMIRSRPDSPAPEELANGAICARAHAPRIGICMEDVIANLRQHLAQEEHADRHVAYNLAAMTGAWVLRLRWFRMDRQELVLREDLADRIALCRLYEEVPPFRFYQHYGYRRAGQHWSERQAAEPLFARR